jgi:hypothetical protein
MRKPVAEVVAHESAGLQLRWVPGHPPAYAGTLLYKDSELPWEDQDFRHGVRLILDAANRGVCVQPHNTTESFIIKRTVEVLAEVLNAQAKEHAP